MFTFPHNSIVFKCHESRFPFDAAHIAMTYTALCTLLILGDDFSRIDRDAIVNGLTYLQKDDGRYASRSFLTVRNYELNFDYV